MYIKILKLVKDILSETENEHIRKELYLRSVGDCCRVYAVLGKTDMKLFKKIVRWKLQTQLQIGRYFPSDFKVKQQEGVKLIGGGFKW